MSSSLAVPSAGGVGAQSLQVVVALRAGRALIGRCLVHPLTVRIQVKVVGEGLGAHSAHVRLLPVVRAHVPLEVRRRRVAAPAHRTVVPTGTGSVDGGGRAAGGAAWRPALAT